MVTFLVIVLLVFFVIPLVRIWLRVRGVRNELNELFKRGERQAQAQQRREAQQGKSGKNRWKRKKAKGDYVDFEEIDEPIDNPQTQSESTRGESMVSDVDFEEIIDP